MTNLGYACLLVDVENNNFRTLRKASITEDKLLEIIKHNLTSLENIIDYNIKKNIKLFRITSDLIPFGSSNLNTLNWKEIFKDDFDRISKKVHENQMRLTMHPGQYTILNSLSETVVLNSIMDLKYHHDILEALKLDYTSKMVLHIGGVYGNKEDAIARFITNFNKLDEGIKRRLIIENDERSYNIEEVLYISNIIKIPTVFDNLHHKINSPLTYKSDDEWIQLASLTWKKEDGRQKIHYSQQDPNKNIGAHSLTIDEVEFMDWYNKLTNKNIDIMFEVKDKNISQEKIAKLL